MGGNNFPRDIDLDVFVNNGHVLENQIEQEQDEQDEGQIPAPAPAAVQLVYECCDRIRLQGLHPHPDIRRISGDLLRLEDTNNDFKLYWARVEKRALDLVERLEDVYEHPTHINFTPYDPTLRVQLMNEAWDVIIEFRTTLLGRLKRMHYMYKYHIRSIQALQLRKQKGDLGSDIFSQAKFDYLRTQLTSLQINSEFNALDMLPIAFLVYAISRYVLHYQQRRTEKKTDALPPKSVQGCCSRSNKAPNLLKFFYLMCTVIITAIFIVRNSQLFSDD